MKTKLGKGIFKVYCYAGTMQATHVLCLLTDANGNVADEKYTDSKGYAELYYTHCGEYSIRAKAAKQYSPAAQNQWVTLHFESNCGCNFIFQPPCCNLCNGSLVIRLSDVHYPQYHLEKGEYTLWLGSK